MCGIAGIFHYLDSQKPIDRKELIAMGDSMFRRGPDSSGSWISDNRNIGFSHRRLSVIDLSDNASQPMLDNDNGNVIVFNGEIYNFPRLKKHLISLGYKFKSRSDTEVLLKMYAHYGIKMVDMLRGMFAFAIWDKKKQGLFLSRDHFGIKPLYIYDDGKALRFCSQVKSFNTSNVKLEMDTAAQVGFYLWGHIPEPFTTFKNIFSLESGSCLWIDSKTKSKYKFFDISNEIISGKSSESNTKNYLEDLENLISDSIQKHLVSDVKTGLFLSSGIDSCLILALATDVLSRQQNDSEKLKTITLGFDEFKNTKNDETILAQKVARYYQTNHHTEIITKQTFDKEISHFFDCMDQPSIDGLNTYFVSKVAKESGLKVALSGVGSDEIFGGYSSFKDIPNIVNWFGSVSKIFNFGKGFRRLSSPVLGRYISPKYASIFEYSKNFADAYFLRRCLYMPWELSDFLDKEIVDEGLERLQTLSSLGKSINAINSSRDSISTLEMTWYLKNQLLKDTDWASMAHSIEVRTPFIDIDLFRGVIKLSSSDFNLKKSDLTNLGIKKIPSYISKRKKTGFSTPAYNWSANKRKVKNISGRSSRDLSHMVWERFNSQF